MSTYDRPATDRKPLFFRTTRCNKPFARPRDVLPQTLQLIKSAHRLHMFGIRRFGNINYFKIYKRIRVRKICIESDHFPIESSTCWAHPFPLLTTIACNQVFLTSDLSLSLPAKSDLISNPGGIFIRHVVRIYLDFLITGHASNYLQSFLIGV